MIDKERNELVRWAAEEVFGWTKAPWPWGWHGVDGETYGVFDFEGWPGFGLAVETATSRGLWEGIVCYYRTEYEVCFHNDEGYCISSAVDTDPGLAAWRALREALNA